MGLIPLVGLTPVTILGGRWDGHEVEFRGERVEYKGENFVLLRTDDDRFFYLVETMTHEWFRVER